MTTQTLAHPTTPIMGNTGIVNLEETGTPLLTSSDHLVSRSSSLSQKNNKLFLCWFTLKQSHVVSYGLVQVVLWFVFIGSVM